VLFSFIVLAFRDFSLWENHFWPFNEVQNGNQREVTAKCRNFVKQKETKKGKSLFGSGDRKIVLFSLLPSISREIPSSAQIAKHTGARASPQTEKQSAATQ